MELITNEKATKEKKGYWAAFLKFLAMGGFMVILVPVVVIAIIVSVLTKYLDLAPFLRNLVQGNFCTANFSYTINRLEKG